MNLARISVNGQLTLPIEIRKFLSVKPGDKVLFFRNKEGDVVVQNASNEALMKAQRAFKDFAEEFNIKDENDVQNLIDEIRCEKDRK